MSATLIETNTVPLKRTAVDPVTLDIIENALKNARFEMGRRAFPHRDVARHSRTA